MLASSVLIAVAGVAAAGAAVAGAAGVAPAAKHGPRIVAKPDSVMVNTRTTLTGTGFRRHKRLTIWECSAQDWVVPQQICNHRNAVTVRTNARGGFTVKMKALVCPAPAPPLRPAGFSKHCWVGVPRAFGVDQAGLRAATRITVTGP